MTEEEKIAETLRAYPIQDVPRSLMTRKPDGPALSILTGFSEGVHLPLGGVPYIRKVQMSPAFAAPYGDKLSEACQTKGCSFAQEHGAPEHSCGGQYCHTYKDAE